MYFVLAVIPLLVVIAWMFRRESKRQEDVRLKEEAFLASVRANPLGPSPTVRAHVQPAQSATELLSAGASPTTRAPNVLTPVLPLMPIVSGAPGENQCVLCGEAVDTRATDQTRWGVKIPDEATGRFRWFHFHCVTHQLQRVHELEAALTQLVNAHGAGTADSTERALGAARQALSRG